MFFIFRLFGYVYYCLLQSDIITSIIISDFSIHYSVMLLGIRYRHSPFSISDASVCRRRCCLDVQLCVILTNIIIVYTFTFLFVFRSLFNEKQTEENKQTKIHFNGDLNTVALSIWTSWRAVNTLRGNYFSHNISLTSQFGFLQPHLFQYYNKYWCLLVFFVHYFILKNLES